MLKSDEIRLRHMLDAAREAIDLCAGRSRTDLLQDRVLTLALVRCIEIIGEAASKVSPATQAMHVDIPWRDIVGMRNRLIHALLRHRPRPGPRHIGRGLATTHHGD